jgi:iron complex transport system ATP-binding protein
MSDHETLLRGVDLTVSVNGLRVASKLALNLRPGQCWCLLGRNGVGKTTLLHTLAGLRDAQGGTVQLGGRPLHSFSRKQIAQRLAILFQHQSDSFPASVRETVLQGRHPYLHAWQWETAHDHRLVSELLAQLELEDLQWRNVQTLSGGERQRVAIATLLAQQTGVLLLDEPVNHLDVKHRLGLLEALGSSCREQGRAALMSLHDINLAARFCDHALLLLGDGEVRQGPVDEVLDSSVLEALYGYPLTEIKTATGRAWLPR